MNVPTLVLDGSESRPHQRNACRLLAATLPRAKRRTLPGQSDEVEPEALAPVLVEFFSGRNGAVAASTKELALPAGA